jgi:hypothetical protein
MEKKNITGIILSVIDDLYERLKDLHYRLIVYPNNRKTKELIKRIKKINEKTYK